MPGINPKNSKLISRENQKEIEVGVCLVPLGAEFFLFQLAIQKCKD
jgi:hypothetical protein